MIEAVIASALQACPLPEDRFVSRGEQARAYAERSVAIVNAAKAMEREKIEEWVRDDADFSVLIGHLRNLTGSGYSGAINFVPWLFTDRYVYTLSYDHAPAEPCGEHVSEVQFPNQNGESTTVVKFVYDDGMLVSASGTSLNIHSGALQKVSD